MAKPNKVKRKRAINALVKERGCLDCGRWVFLAKQIYESTGELCSAASCPNAIENRVDFEPEVSLSFDVAFADFQLIYEDHEGYEDNAALNEKSEEAPASLTTKTST